MKSIGGMFVPFFRSSDGAMVAELVPFTKRIQKTTPYMSLRGQERGSFRSETGKENDGGIKKKTEEEKEGRQLFSSAQGYAGGGKLPTRPKIRGFYRTGCKSPPGEANKLIIIKSIKDGLRDSLEKANC